MPKYCAPVFLFFLILWTVFVPLSVYAQTNTPAPAAGLSPTPGISTCDLCGWCGFDSVSGTSIEPSPANWPKCRECLYDAGGAPREHAYWTTFGCMYSTSDLFVKKLVSIVIGIAGGTAFLFFLYGSVMVLTSSGDPQKLKDGRETITSSLIGIFLIVFSIFLLRVVGYDILRIPGFG